MKLKRDISSDSAPAPNQIEIGELLINAKTGIMYSKRVDGTVIKWIGNEVCDTITVNSGPPIPTIGFSDTSSFCCGGRPITITVNNLIVNSRYKLSITDLQQNSGVIISTNESDLLPINTSQRSVILNIGITSAKPTAILKFSISQVVPIAGQDTSLIKSEKILTITCQNC